MQTQENICLVVFPDGLYGVGQRLNDNDFAIIMGLSHDSNHYLETGSVVITFR